MNIKIHMKPPLLLEIAATITKATPIEQVTIKNSDRLHLITIPACTGNTSVIKTFIYLIPNRPTPIASNFQLIKSAFNYSQGMLNRMILQILAKKI